MTRMGFVTCVQLGLSCIQEIYASGGALDLIVTLHDEMAVAKSGRIYLDAICRERGVKLLKVRHINDAEAVDAIHACGIDWLFIVGWSQVAGKNVLQAPRKGVLGMHPTLLPQGRGRAPIPWALIKGLERTGVTLFMLDEGVDTGPILAQEILPIARDESATSLYERVNHAHRTLIRRVWHDLAEDRLSPVPQDESQASLWPARRPHDGNIDARMTVMEVDRLVRGCTHPYPGAFKMTAAGKCIIWRGRPARSGEGHDCVEGTWIQCADGGYVATSVDWASSETAPSR